MDIETLTEPRIIGIFLVVSVFSALIPALVLKWIMGAKYLHRVSYLAVLFVLATSYIAMMIVLAWLGLLDEASLDSLPLIPAALLTVAGTAIQLILLTALVPDEEGRMISMWKWLVVTVLQWVVYFVISAIVVLAVVGFSLITAASQ